LLIGYVAGLSTIWSLTGGNSKGIGHGFNVRTMFEGPDTLLDFSKMDSSMQVGLERYLIPSQSFGIQVMKVTMVNESTIYDSYNDFYQQKAKNWGISAGLTIYGVGVDVSYSKLKGELKQQTKNFSRAFSYGEYVWHAFDLEVDWAYAQLDPEFKADVLTLPTDYTRGAGVYRKFIGIYGTHFFNKVAYGCRFNYTLAFDKDLIDKKSSKWVQTQFGIAVSYSYGGFGIKLGFDFAKFKNTTKVDGLFTQKSSGRTRLLGGDETLFPQGLDKWYPSCQKNREILLEKSKITPIAELLKFDPVRKANLIKALQDYARTP